MSEATRRRLERSASAVFMCALLLVGVVLVFWGTSARAKQFATLNILEGVVDVQHGDGAFQPGREGEALRQGDTLRTGVDGIASIEYFDGSLTRIEDSVFTFLELSTIDEVADSKVIVGEQLQGNSFNRVVELTDPQSRFDILTPTVETSVSGSVYAVLVDDDGSTTIVVIEGSVIATGTDSGVEVEVTEGTMLVTEADGSVGDPQEIPEAVLESDWIEYNECALDQAPDCLPVVPGEPEPPVAPDPEGEQPGEETPPPTTGTDPDPGNGGGPEPTPPVTSTPPPPPPPPPPPDSGAPHAGFRLTPESGEAPLLVHISDDSSDPDGGALTREWTFGDGGSATGDQEFDRTYREPGRYTITLTVTDPEGHSDTASRALVVKPDTTAPVVTITSGPADPSASPDPEFTFTTSELGAGFICVLDGVAQACGGGESGSVTYTGLLEGLHLFSVSVTDDAGNTGAASAAWTIDIPPVFDHIVISPEAATIQLDGTQAFTAEAFDTEGLSMGDVTAQTTFSIAPDGSCTGPVCGATALGDHTVTGTYLGSSDTATLLVEPLAPVFDHIVISPATATIEVGGSKTYTVEAFDTEGVSMGDVTAQTTFAIAPDGSCTDATCTAAQAGQHTVTGTYLGSSDTAQLTVTEPPEVVSLVFAAQPGGSVAGGTLSPAVQIDVVNLSGQPVSGSGCSISVSLGDNEEGASLSGDTGPTTATGTQVTFSPLSVNLPGAYRLVATSTNCQASVTSGKFKVDPGGSSATGGARRVAVGIVLLLPLLGFGGWRLRLTLQGPDRDLGFGPKRR